MDAQKRERAKGEAKELDQKENAFHLRQAKVRAGIRIKEGRAKQIAVTEERGFTYTDPKVSPMPQADLLALCCLRGWCAGVSPHTWPAAWP